MERIQSINPKRIEWCCADYGITLKVLASELNISPKTIFSLQEGEGLTFRQLQKIAAYFGRGVLFFLDPLPVVPEQVHTPQFRTIAQQNPELSQKLKALIGRVEHQREIFLNLREGVGDANWSPFEVPKLPTKTIADAANFTREWLGLSGSNDFESYRNAIQSKGILVFHTNGYNGQWQIAKDSAILGFSLYDEKCPVIVVKKISADARQVFTLMHELGHILLHKASWIDDESSIGFGKQNAQEQEANLFAGLVLVPDKFLTYINDKNRPKDVRSLNDWLKVQSRNWGVSTEVILRRLMDVGRLPESIYREYRNWYFEFINKNNEKTKLQITRHRYFEPKNIFGDPYVRTVLTSLNARHITIAKASSYLDNLSIPDMHKLEQVYATS